MKMVLGTPRRRSDGQATLSGNPSCFSDGSNLHLRRGQSHAASGAPTGPPQPAQQPHAICLSPFGLRLWPGAALAEIKAAVFGSPRIFPRSHVICDPRSISLSGQHHLRGHKNRPSAPRGPRIWQQGCRRFPDVALEIQAGNAALYVAHAGNDAGKHPLLPYLPICVLAASWERGPTRARAPVSVDLRQRSTTVLDVVMLAGFEFSGVTLHYGRFQAPREFVNPEVSGGAARQRRT
jgi:hypothetical protein